jgi:hypothetical protein
MRRLRAGHKCSHSVAGHCALHRRRNSMSRAPGARRTPAWPRCRPGAATAPSPRASPPGRRHSQAGRRTRPRQTTHRETAAPRLFRRADVVVAARGADVAHPRAQHRLVEIDPDDATAGPFGDRERDTGRTGRDVQDLVNGHDRPAVQNDHRSACRNEPAAAAG